MRKRISLFRVRLERPDPETLGIHLIERRLERLRRAIEHSQPAVDWLDISTNTWRMQKNSDEEALIASSIQPSIYDFPSYPQQLALAEQAKIMAWSKSWVGRMAPASPLPAKLPKEEREALAASAKETRAVYLTEHQVDVAFADVHAKSPWLAALTAKAWQIALRRAKFGLPTGVGALLLSGPPGLGKSSWARAVAQALTVPSLEVDVGATGGTFDLQGISRGWGSAEKGRLISMIIDARIGNPCVILDEIDAGSRVTGATQGSAPGLYKVLMGMMEPSTAKAWVCPYLHTVFDLRHVSWICSTNDISNVEQALLDRMTLIEVPRPSTKQLLEFAQREAEMRFDEDFVEIVMGQIEKTLKKGSILSLRHVVKLIDKVEYAIDRPLLH